MNGQATPPRVQPRGSSTWAGTGPCPRTASRPRRCCRLWDTLSLIVLAPHRRQQQGRCWCCKRRSWWWWWGWRPDAGRCHRGAKRAPPQTLCPPTPLPPLPGELPAAPPPPGHQQRQQHPTHLPTHPPPKHDGAHWQRPGPTGGLTAAASRTAVHPPPLTGTAAATQLLGRRTSAKWPTAGRPSIARGCAGCQGANCSLLCRLPGAGAETSMEPFWLIATSQSRLAPVVFTEERHGYPNLPASGP